MCTTVFALAKFTFFGTLRAEDSFWYVTFSIKLLPLVRFVYKVVCYTLSFKLCWHCEFSDWRFDSLCGCHLQSQRWPPHNLSKRQLITVNSSPIQHYNHPDDHTQPTYEMAPGCWQDFSFVIDMPPQHVVITDWKTYYFTKIKSTGITINRLVL